MDRGGVKRPRSGTPGKKKEREWMIFWQSKTNTLSYPKTHKIHHWPENSSKKKDKDKNKKKKKNKPNPKKTEGGDDNANSLES